jgi:hypothetical protein
MRLKVIVALACVVASTARCSTDQLSSARTNANAASAIASLRTIASAQFTYSAVCALGFYAPSLKALAAPPADGKDAFISPDLSSDPSVKSGYTITLVPGSVATEAASSCNGLGPGLSVRDFFVSAAPTQAGSAPYLALISNGTVYRSSAPIRPVFGAAPPAPAVPVQ